MKDIKNESGIFSATPVLEVDEYIQNTYLTNRRIWILQTWIGNMNVFEKALRCAVERRLEVKIALLNPLSNHLKSRSSDLLISGSEIKEKIWSNLNKLESIAIDNNYTDDLEVKIYDCSPTLGIYMLDTKLNLGFYWKQKNSTKGPNLILRMDDIQSHFFSQQVLNHFELIWNEAESINFRNRNWRNKYTQD